MVHIQEEVFYWDTGKAKLVSVDGTQGSRGGKDLLIIVACFSSFFGIY